MNQLLAKLKGQPEEEYFKLLSGEKLYSVDIDNLDLVEFNPVHNLDEDCWFKVEGFSRQPYCISLLRNRFASAEYNTLPRDKIFHILYICAIQRGNFYFQKAMPSSFIVQKKMFVFGEDPYVEKEDAQRLVISTIPDAIYLKKQDILIFRKIEKIFGIFPSIVDMYKVATDQDVEEFLKHSFIEFDNGYEVRDVSRLSRKHIALATDTLGKMNPSQERELVQYIKKYCNKKLQFTPNGKAVIVSKNSDLKLFLYGLGQRFYTTQIGQREKRLANSVQLLK